MKLFETSVMDLPLTLLRNMFRVVDEYYLVGGKYNTAAYQHVYTGLIVMLLACNLAVISLWFLLIIPVVMVYHVVVEEVWLDAKKRTTDYEKHVAYPANVIERIYGFVLGSPFVLLPVLSG